MSDQPFHGLQSEGPHSRQTDGPSLYTDLCALEQLRQAYTHVQENTRELGIDPLVLETIEAEGVEAFLKQLNNDLRARTYHPSQEAEREGRIVLRELVVQVTLKRCLESTFPPVFSSNPDIEKTIKWLAGNIDKGLCRAFAVSLIESLGDGEWERLLERAGRRIGDPHLVSLIKELLTASQPSKGVLIPLLADIAFEQIDHILQQAKALGREGNFFHVQCTRVGNELIVLVDRDPRYDWMLPAVQKRLREELSNLHYDSAAVETQSLDLTDGEPLHFLSFELRWVRRSGGEGRTMYRLVERATRDQRESTPSGQRSRGRYHPLRFAQYGLDGMKHLLRLLLIQDAYAKVNSIQVSWRHLPITLYPLVAFLSGWRSPVAWLCLALSLVCNWRRLPGLMRFVGAWVRQHSLDAVLGACALAALIWLVPQIADLWAHRPQEVSAPSYMPAGFYKGQFHGDSWWSDEPTSGVTYGLYVPPHLQGHKGPFPLIIFLHSYDGRTEPRLFRRNLLTALAKRLDGKDGTSARFDFIAFAPIDPSGRWLPKSTEVRNVLKALDYVMRRHRIDAGRVYLTGIAEGADGVWRLAEAYPDRWAALVPVHSSYQPPAQKVQHLPAWLFDAPPNGPASMTNQKALLTELQKINADVRYSQTAKRAEAVWTEVYHSQSLYDWLVMKKKG